MDEVCSNDALARTRGKVDTVSAEAKKHYGSMVAFLALGILALYGGPQLLLLPAATVVWYGANPKLRSGRN